MMRSFNLEALPARRRMRSTPIVCKRSRYCRQTDLPKLIGLWPSELADTSPEGRAKLVAKLKRALRQERLRGLSGHWTYNLARHSQLLDAYRIEAQM